MTDTIPTQITAHLLSALKGGAEVVCVLTLPADAVPKPVWFPMPGRGRTCAVTGLATSTLRDLVVRSRESANPVRTRHLKAPDKSRGVRLVHYATLMAWLETQPEWGEMVGKAEKLKAEPRT